MSINLSVPIKPSDLKPRIVVFGVGGAGGNAVNNMIQSNLEGVECMVANTDAQALALSLAERCIQLGRNITQGLGAGSRPDIGRAAAEEGIDEILEQLQGCHMLFIAAGMGGGTGTGAGPVIARAARDQGILTVGVVTKPFHFEGPHRMAIAEQGLEELQQVVDTMIVIPNQNLFRVATEKTTFADAFKMADNVLYSGVRGVTDLMVMPGLINLDFADIRTVMSEMGKAMMGAGEADGQERSRAAAEQAIANPLLDDVSMKGARGVLINITGGMDMTLFEVDEAVNRIRDEVDGNANLIFGSTFDDSLDGSIRVSIFATGIDAQAMTAPRPKPIRLVATDGSLSGPGEKPLEATEEDSRAEEPVAPTGDAAAAAESLLGLEIDAEVEMAPEAVIGATGVEANYDMADDLWEAAADPVEVTPDDVTPDDVASEDEGPGLFRAMERHEAPAEPETAEPEFAETELTIPEEDVPEMTQPAETLAEPAVSEPQDEPKRQYLAEPEELPREKVAPFPRIDSSDRLPESEEEDLLEIPAFLRRQAN